jgi:hypothetical protein
MNELTKQIIAERRKWLNEQRIEDWNAQDTDFVAERFAKEQTEIHDAKIKYYEDKIEMLIRTSAEMELASWNAAIDAAAEGAKIEVTEIATGEKFMVVDASINNKTSLTVSKKSILNLKK